jgi:3'-phosphoadenosine 5'-phosphosulfate sulfotransferase (PAPS reductase)/FAD synthetase
MKHIYSISGGQDSTAMTIRALELGYPVDYIIFCDTGNEFPQMIDYLHRLDDYIKRNFNKSITFLSAPLSLKELVFSPFKKGKNKGIIRGLPYASSMSFCTRELKKNVTERFLKSLNDDCIQYIGYVSRERNRVHQSDKKFITYKFPLIEWDWNEPEVSSYLKEKTLFNELYNHFTRTGCMFCPKQTLDSWFVLYSQFPDKWNEAKKWELQTKKLGAHIKNFRSDFSLIQLEYRFSKRLKAQNNTPQFEFDWNQEDVSCMCK